MEIKMIIKIDIEKELDYEADYMGICSCGCSKELYKGMTIFSLGYETIYIDCLENYLKYRKEVL